MAIFRALPISVMDEASTMPIKLGWKAAEPHGALGGARLPRASFTPFPWLLLPMTPQHISIGMFYS